LMRNRQPAKALEEFQAVTRVMPYRADAFINTATSLNQMRRNREALDAYTKAFALEPTWEVSANLNHEYGFVLVAAGEAAKAREVFGKAVATQEPPRQGAPLARAARPLRGALPRRRRAPGARQSS